MGSEDRGYQDRCFIIQSQISGPDLQGSLSGIVDDPTDTGSEIVMVFCGLVV